MKAACRWGPAIDAAWGPVLPPDAGRLLHRTARTYANTLQGRDAAGAFRNRVAGVRGRRHRLELVGSVRRSGLRRRPRPVHGQRHGRRGVRVPTRRGAAVDRLASAKAGKPAPNAVAEWVEVLEASSSAFARSGRPRAMSGSKPRGPRGPHHTLCFERDHPDGRGPRAYPVNLIDEYDGTVLVTSPDFPELTTFGAVRAEALAHAVGAFAEASRRGIHAPMDVPGADAHGDCAHVATLTITKVLLYRGSATRVSRVSRSELARRLNWHLPRSIACLT